MGFVYSIVRRSSPLLLLFAVGCGANAGPEPGAARAAVAAPPAAAVDRDASPNGPLVAFLGDSLTAGLGLSLEQAFPALLGERLRGEGLTIRVVNAGVSGDTTAGGLARIDWLLAQRPDVVVVGLGVNDAMRGQPLEDTEANLRSIVRRAKGAGAAVLLLGMRVPTNFGPDYTARFHEIYARVARDEGADLVPFLLDGVGGKPDLNLGDGVHPNAQGHRILATNVLPRLRTLVKRVLRNSPRSSARSFADPQRSQASPIPSRSESAWSAFATAGQLSQASPTQSRSPSTWDGSDTPAQKSLRSG